MLELPTSYKGSKGQILEAVHRSDMTTLASLMESHSWRSKGLYRVLGTEKM